jgi:hypothetical protein
VSNFSGINDMSGNHYDNEMKNFLEMSTTVTNLCDNAKISNRLYESASSFNGKIQQKYPHTNKIL